MHALYFIINNIRHNLIIEECSVLIGLGTGLSLEWSMESCACN